MSTARKSPPGLLTLFAGVSLAAWAYLASRHGGFWRLRYVPTCRKFSGVAVIAIVPARDEADVVGRCIETLLNQNLEPPLEVVLVDDHSADGTAAAALTVATALKQQHRLSIMRGGPLPDGWTGKLWALEQGWQAVKERQARYILFTDADIEHQPSSIPTLLAQAVQHRAQLASFMVRLATDTVAERLLIPVFVYFFFQLYPPEWVNRAERKTAGAAGGCVLIETAMLRRLNGLESIRSAVIDDCALAAAVKRQRGRLLLYPTELSRSLRSYGGVLGVGRMISRSAFYQLRHSFMLLAGTVAALAIVYLVPVIAVLLPGKPRNRSARPLGLAAWLLMSFTYLPMLRAYCRPALQALSLPLVSCVYVLATIHSAVAYKVGRGGTWKGRSQDFRR